MCVCVCYSLLGRSWMTGRDHKVTSCMLLRKELASLTNKGPNCIDPKTNKVKINANKLKTPRQNMQAS